MSRPEKPTLPHHGAVVKDGTWGEFVREQLGGLPNVEFRRMFGGHGVYQDGDFFGILYQGRLYFKTDATSRADYDAAGMEPFRPNAKQCLPAYREVPVAVLEDAERLCAWALRAIQCGAAGQAREKAKRLAGQRRTG